MTEWVEELTGNDWEEHCHTLLRYRYSPVNVQAVPAVQGDLGIDFWIRGSGDIYQCYGSEADSAKDRLRLQKDKLRAEAAKLKRYSDRIGAMIAPAICSRYVFLVPLYENKELLELAATLAQDIRASALVFCTADFEIVVHHLQDFLVEREEMQRAGLAAPRLNQTELDGQDVHDWLTDNGDLARTIREKIEAARPSGPPERIDQWVQGTVGNYLRGEDAMATLEAAHPDLYERVRLIMATRRNRLNALGGGAAGLPADTLRDEFDDLAAALAAPDVGMHVTDAGILTEGTIAKWLAECTLETR